jgi:hypothetical protein
MSTQTYSEIAACYINEGDEVSALGSYEKEKNDMASAQYALDQARRPATEVA